MMFDASAAPMCKTCCRQMPWPINHCNGQSSTDCADLWPEMMSSCSCDLVMVAGDKLMKGKACMEAHPRRFASPRCLYTWSLENSLVLHMWVDRQLYVPWAILDRNVSRAWHHRKPHPLLTQDTQSCLPAPNANTGGKQGSLHTSVSFRAACLYRRPSTRARAPAHLNLLAITASFCTATSFVTPL